MLQIHVLQQYMTVNGMWGEIIEFDDEDLEYHISFVEIIQMARKGPPKEPGILCSVDNPVKHRKTRNMFKFSAIEGLTHRISAKDLHTVLPTLIIFVETLRIRKKPVRVKSHLQVKKRFFDII